MELPQRADWWQAADAAFRSGIANAAVGAEQERNKLYKQQIDQTGSLQKSEQAGKMLAEFLKTGQTVAEQLRATNAPLDKVVGAINPLKQAAQSFSARMQQYGISGVADPDAIGAQFDAFVQMPTSQDVATASGQAEATKGITTRDALMGGGVAPSVAGMNVPGAVESATIDLNRAKTDAEYRASVLKLLQPQPVGEGIATFDPTTGGMSINQNVVDAKEGIARAGRTPAYTPFETKMQEGDAKFVTELQDKGVQAQQAMRNLDIAVNLIKTISGPAANITADVAKWAAELGVTLPVGKTLDEAGKVEAANALFNRLIFDELGGRLGNQISDADRAFIERMNPGVLMSGPGIETLAGIMRSSAQRQINTSEITSRYLEEVRATGGEFSRQELDRRVKSANEASGASQAGQPVKAQRAGGGNKENETKAYTDIGRQLFQQFGAP